MRPKRLLLCGIAATALLGCQSHPSDDPADAGSPSTAPVTHPETGIALPHDYRETFTNYLSLDRVQNHDQIIRLFANDIALQGPNADNEMPLGSMIVAEVYKAKLDADGEVELSSLGRRVRDKMALVAVMERGEHLGQGYPEELQNGSWDFAAFTPNGGVANKDLDSCRACHAPLKSTDHLFSMDHLQPAR